MITMLWASFVAKAITTSLIVVSASVAAEVLGPAWGAIIACLPVSAGPAYVFLAMQHDQNFVAISALNSAATNAATGLLLISYGVLGRHMSPWRCLGVAVGVWLFANLVIQREMWTPTAAAALNAAMYGAGFFVMRMNRKTETEPLRQTRRKWFDLPLRAAAVAAFVSLVVTISSVLGPVVTGIAAVFPVSLISLIAILRPRLGGQETARLAFNALPPMLGFGVALLAMHLTIQHWGVAAALALALAICILWSGALLLLLRLQPWRKRKYDSQTASPYRSPDKI